MRFFLCVTIVFTIVFTALLATEDAHAQELECWVCDENYWEEECGEFGEYISVCVGHVASGESSCDSWGDCDINGCIHDPEPGECAEPEFALDGSAWAPSVYAYSVEVVEALVAQHEHVLRRPCDGAVLRRAGDDATVARLRQAARLIRL